MNKTFFFCQNSFWHECEGPKTLVGKGAAKRAGKPSHNDP